MSITMALRRPVTMLMHHPVRTTHVTQCVMMLAHKEESLIQFVVAATAKKSSLVLVVKRRNAQTATVYCIHDPVATHAMAVVLATSTQANAAVVTHTVVSHASLKLARMIVWAEATATKTLVTVPVAMTRRAFHLWVHLVSSGHAPLTALVVGNVTVTMVPVSARMATLANSVRRQLVVSRDN